MAKSGAAKIKEAKLKKAARESQKKEKKEKAAKKEKTAKKKHETNEVGIRTGTVLETIFDCLKKGATTAQMKEACAKAHPDRDPDAMEKTIRLQLHRMPTEKGFTLKKIDSDEGKVYKIDKILSDDEKAKAKKKVKDKKEKKAKKKAEEEEAEEEESEEDEEEEEEEDEDEDDDD